MLVKEVLVITQKYNHKFPLVYRFISEKSLDLTIAPRGKRGSAHSRGGGRIKLVSEQVMAKDRVDKLEGEVNNLTSMVSEQQKMMKEI